MRLGPDVLAEADQLVDPNNDRCLVLRGLKLSVIENLGVTKNQYGCIDLSDNEITKVSNIPKLTRLRTLLLAHNAISRIANDAFDFLPELTSLVLTHNRISKLSVLLPLAKLKRLQRLSLQDNPVTKEPNYRWFVIHLLNYSQVIRFLDFQRITRAERIQAREFFNSLEGQTVLHQIVPDSREDEIRPVKIAPVEAKPALSQDILAKIRVALTEATDMDELNILERALKTGEISDQVAARLGLK